MVNISSNDRICDTCRNTDICKYHDGVMKEINRIGKDGTNYPLKITFYCVHHVGNKPELRETLRGGERFM